VTVIPFAKAPATTDAAGSPVQFDKFPLVGVPKIGVVKTQEVAVDAPVNVFAASVRAIVADVVGNVIIVESVPENVSELLAVIDFPAATVNDPIN
jgi:hypothetical protein